MKKTTRDRLVDGLTALGFRRVANPRTRRFYAVFADMTGGFYYVGKSGALRYGVNVKISIPLGATQREEILREERREV